MTITSNTIPSYKKCAGKSCNNEGSIKIKIKYIKKSGYFCKFCAIEVKKLDLIEDGNTNDY